MKVYPLLFAIILLSCQKKNTQKMSVQQPEKADSIVQVKAETPPFEAYTDTFYGQLIVTDYIPWIDSLMEMYVTHPGPGWIQFTKIENHVNQLSIGGWTDYYNLYKSGHFYYFKDFSFYYGDENYYLIKGDSLIISSFNKYGPDFLRMNYAGVWVNKPIDRH